METEGEKSKKSQVSKEVGGEVGYGHIMGIAREDEQKRAGLAGNAGVYLAKEERPVATG